MKIINLDELEQKCIKWGLDNKLFTQEELGKDNKFTINFNSRYQSKTCDISYLGLKDSITFSSETWEDLYYQLDDFFRNSWDYTTPIDMGKAPLYMRITERLKTHTSKDGTVKLFKVQEELVKSL